MDKQKNMKSKYRASDYNLDLTVFPDGIQKEINDELKNLSKTRRGQLCKSYETPEDFFTIFYGLRFVLRNSNEEISKALNTSHDYINHTLEGLNIEYSDDYEINKQMFNEHYSNLQKRRENGIERIKALDVSHHPELAEILDDPKKVRIAKKIVKSGTCGDTFADYQDFIKQIYYFYVIEGISPKDMCKMFNWYNGSMQNWLKKMGIRRTPEEGMRAKIKNKSQNYQKTYAEGLKTTLKSQIDFSNPRSSKNENVFRHFLAIDIINHFDNTIYDVGVCCKNVGILGAKETDIPIFIYNKKLQCLHRFVIEYNGPLHTDDSDKINRARENGWEYIPIEDKPEYSRNEEIINERARSFGNELAEKVSKRENGCGDSTETWHLIVARYEYTEKEKL